MANEEPISWNQLQEMWGALTVLARNVRRDQNQHADSYRTSDVLQSAMRRLSSDASKWEIEGKELTWENRTSFFAAAATAMRRAIIDHVRSRNADKRPSSRQRLPLDDGMFLAQNAPTLLLDIEECLEKLRKTHPQIADLIEKKLYLPTTQKELGEFFDIPSSTVNDRLTKGRAFLAHCLGHNEP